MDILWDLGSATVADVHARLQDRPIAYTTVLSTLTILERKAYVRHTMRGKANVYKPRVERDAARRTVVENVLATFFEGSPRALMLNLLESERLNPDEERRLRSLLEDTSRRKRLADAGYDRSQEFTWAASAEAHLASYRRAAEQTAADVSAV